MNSGLPASAEQFNFCYNGYPNELHTVERLSPSGSIITCHGENSFSENLTITKMQQWSWAHPGWYVFYFHTKGASHNPADQEGRYCAQWRGCMLYHLVDQWKDCVCHLDNGAEMVTCHWLTGMADGTQCIPAGNFVWVKTDFLNTLPDIRERARCKISGIASLESRFEAEVFWGNGIRLPSVVDKHRGHPKVHHPNPPL